SGCSATPSSSLNARPSEHLVPLLVAIFPISPAPSRARSPRPAASSSFPLAMNVVDLLLQFLHVVWSSTARITYSWLWKTSKPLLT
ncbi:hypothetical protein ACJX0J_007699, partial [Zea mays]